MEGGGGPLQTTTPPSSREPRSAWRQGQRYRESRPGNFPSSQSLGIGTCHGERGKYFTKQRRHVPYSRFLRNSVQFPGEALLPERWLRKVGFVAAGALGIRGDSQNPGDCTGGAGKVPPVACNVLRPWGLPGRTDGSIPGAQRSGIHRKGSLGTIMNVLQQ